MRKLLRMERRSLVKRLFLAAPGGSARAQSYEKASTIGAATRLYRTEPGPTSGAAARIGLMGSVGLRS